jgi:uncharacterized protein YndB with AHSA1/START domain
MPKKNTKYQIDYVIRSSPVILFEFIATPTGLSQWFADKVELEDNRCIFEWNGSEEVATVIDDAEDVFIRFRWDYQEKDEFFEFRVTKNEVTGDTILTITDFAQPNEIDDQRLLWDRQVKTLIQVLGGAM